MESRFGQQQPNKILKKEIARARRSARRVKPAQGLVIVGSLAATMLGWGFFSQSDAQLAATAQLEEPTAVVASLQQNVTGANSIPTPIVVTLTTADTSRTVPGDDTTSKVTATEAATGTLQEVSTTNVPVAIASTRSSR